MGVNIGNVAPRVGIQSTCLAIWASELTGILHRLTDVTTLHTLTCLGGSLPERSVQTITLALSLGLQVSSCL